MPTFSTELVAMLSALEYKADAGIRISVLPHSGPFWEDEMPAACDLRKLSHEEHDTVYRLFTLRQAVWQREEFTPKAQEMWIAAMRAVPTWPLFRRLELTAQELQMVSEVEESATQILNVFLEDADDYEVHDNHDGTQTFTAKFDLTKSEPALLDDPSPPPPLPQPQQRRWWDKLLRRSR